jgi:hypothetical protein
MGKKSSQIQPNPAKSSQIVAKNIVLSGLAPKNQVARPKAANFAGQTRFIPGGISRGGKALPKPWKGLG